MSGLVSQGNYKFAQPSFIHRDSGCLWQRDSQRADSGQGDDDSPEYKGPEHCSLQALGLGCPLLLAYTGQQLVTDDNQL